MISTKHLPRSGNMIFVPDGISPYARGWITRDVIRLLHHVERGELTVCQIMVASGPARDATILNRVVANGRLLHHSRHRRILAAIYNAVYQQWACWEPRYAIGGGMALVINERYSVCMERILND